MIWVLGSGAFGTALAISMSRSNPVTLWTRDPDYAIEMQTTRENTRRLPGCAFPKDLSISSDLSALPPGAICLLSVPTQKLRALLQDQGKHLARHPLVACCKGIELQTELSPTQIIVDVLPDAQVSILTGPSFATDIARGLPTALTLACQDPELGKHLQKSLSTDNLRIYRSTDVVGAEQGGALKNVVAIACGAATGAELGESARAALMTRGFAEMQRIAHVLGARPETLAGLAGFGDLTLTCSSTQSRNYRYGQSLARGEAIDPSMTVEGIATAKAALDIAKANGIDAPITQAVVALAEGRLRVTEAMDMLLKRPLKEE